MSNELLGCASCSRRCDIGAAFVAKQGAAVTEAVDEYAGAGLAEAAGRGVGSIVVEAEQEA